MDTTLQFRTDVNKNIESNWNFRENWQRWEQNAVIHTGICPGHQELMNPAKSPTGSSMANDQDLVFTAYKEAKAKSKVKQNL